VPRSSRCRRCCCSARPRCTTVSTGAPPARRCSGAWTGATLGILFRIFWVGAPRWLYTPIYLALGWVAIFWLDDFYHRGGASVVTLLAVGGGLYSIGAVVYGLKKPNPSPRWFGFHEIFHACTVAAFVTHYIAVSIAVYRAG
jgi:hemolysin III